MAFNLAKYNLTPFNLRGDKTIRTRIVGYETISASIGTALQVSARAIGYERVNETTKGEMAYRTRPIGEETVNEGVTDGFITVLTRLDFLEEITALSGIAADITRPLTGNENATAMILRGADFRSALSGAEAIETRTFRIGAKVRTAPDGYELVSASANLEAVDMKTAVLTVTLKPGERLIIDASTYNVLLNGKNAIEIHSGDWIDELNRETQSIVITAASGVGNLSASILYTERYL